MEKDEEIERLKREQRAIQTERQVEKTRERSKEPPSKARVTDEMGLAMRRSIEREIM